MGFLRLIRIGNLAIIALTMFGVWVAEDQRTYRETDINFMLFVFFTLLIAGAGNAINDYFDYKSDRINNPQRVVIEKTIKKRWAIIIHWGFNFIALVISIYLSWQLKSWFYVFIHLFATTLLWLYSLHIKRYLFWSNFVISILVALIPLITMKFILDSNVFAIHVESILVFSGFAFVVNFAREIIKDIQDMEGDKLREIKSFALVYGAGSARTITALVLLLLIPLYIVGYSMHAFSFFLWFNVLFIGGYAMGLLGLILLLFQASDKTINTVLKLSLVLGCCSIYFL